MAADTANPIPPSTASTGAVAASGDAPPPAKTPPNQAQPQTSTGKPNLTSAFDELDKIIAEERPADLPTKTPEKEAKPGDENFDGKPADSPQKELGKGQPPVKAATLREALDRAKSEAKDWKAKYETLESEYKKPKPHPDEEKWKSEREKLSRENEELRNEIKFADYTKSPEYREKYEAPFINGYNTGRQKAASLKANAYGEVDAISGEREKTVRQGQKEDWDNFMEIADDDKAAEFAHELWGAKAPVMLYHREQVQKLNSDRIQAIDGFRKTANERLTKEHETMKSEMGKIETAWKAENDAAIAKYPHWFKPADGDAKGNELLEKGFQLADLAFSNEIQKMPIEQRVRVWSAVRNKAAGFDRIAFQNKQFQKKIEELESALKEYQESTSPKTVNRAKSGKMAEGLSAVDASIDQMAGIIH